MQMIFQYLIMICCVVPSSLVYGVAPQPTLPIQPVVKAAAPAPKVQPAPVTSSLPMPTSSVAPAPTASDNATLTPSATKEETKAPEVSDGPLFTKGADDQKKALADTVSDEQKVRESIKRIENMKSKQLQDYLVLDKELDTWAEEIGVARGGGVERISEIKEALWHEIDQKKGDTDDALVAQSEETKKVISELEEKVKIVQTKESAVLDLLKSFSEKTGTLSDMATQIYTDRLSLGGILDDDSAQKVVEGIREKVAELAKEEEALSAPEGLVSQVEKATAEVREAMGSAKELVGKLKGMQVDVIEKIKKISASKSLVNAAKSDVTKKDEAAHSAEAESNEDDVVEEVKPPRRRARVATSWAHGTIFERPYHYLVVGAQALLSVVKPVAQWLARMAGVLGEKAEQALETKNPDALKIDAEMSWGDLGKRFLWKLSASVRRGLQKIRLFAQSDTEKKKAAKVSATQEKSVVDTPPVIEAPAAAPVKKEPLEEAPVKPASTTPSAVGLQKPAQPAVATPVLAPKALPTMPAPSLPASSGKPNEKNAVSPIEAPKPVLNEKDAAAQALASGSGDTGKNVATLLVGKKEAEASVDAAKGVVAESERAVAEAKAAAQQGAAFAA